MVTSAFREERPFHDQVAGRLADGRAAEVDDRVQCPARDEGSPEIQR
jgi:hypothetical protein